jgi:hypothetical protein
MKNLVFLILLLVSTQSHAASTALSFNGNLAGTASISTLQLVVFSGSCNLYSQTYGTVPMDGAGNFSVSLDGTSGTYPGNLSGASYNKLSDIFDTTNSSILGQSSCTVNGASAAWSISVTVNGTLMAGSVPVNAVPFAVRSEISSDTKKLAGTNVSGIAPTTNQVLQFISGAWTPATVSGGGTVTGVTATSPLSSTGGAAPSISLGGLSSFGSANQVLGMNATGTAMEYKSFAMGAGLGLNNSANTLSLNLSGELNGMTGLTGTGFVKRTGTATYAVSTGASLTTDVTGILPIANGGTNSTTTLFNNRIMISAGGTIAENSLLPTNAPMRTGATGLPTTGLISLAGETTGVLPVASGGTGTTNGSITGTSALNFTAGGASQNVTLAPSGTGNVILNGMVGINNAAPQSYLDVAGGIRGRINYPSCPTGCSALSLPLSGANHFLMNVNSGNITAGVANASTFASFDGVEFSVTVCATGGSAIPVSFGGHASGFANGITWANVAVGNCTAQTFVIMNNSGFYAHPLTPAITYTY